jgi:uncharacterized protein YigA (DUF484 family)
MVCLKSGGCDRPHIAEPTDESVRMKAPSDAAASAPAKSPSADAVAKYLRAHPNFLARHTALYRVLTPPERVHGEALADHMAAMLRAERAHAALMAERADGVLAAGRATAGLAARVQEAVLALIAATDPIECIGAEFATMLAVDGASLCIESDMAGTRRLPRGIVSALLGGRGVVFRQGGDDAALLHGEAAGLSRHEVLVRVPGDGPAALVALVARDARALDPSQGTGALAFLGRAVAAALHR